jgi:hypothetical protein
MNKYPEKTEVVVRWNEVIRRKEAPVLSERASSRMVKIAAHLPENEFIGWQMRVPAEGLAEMESFGTAAVRISDLEWIAEESVKTAATSRNADAAPDRPEASDPPETQGELYEIYLPVETGGAPRRIGFGGDADPATAEDERQSNASRKIWPTYFPLQFGEFIKALRSEGAFLRYAVGRATAEEREMCEKAVLSTLRDGVDADGYIGAPVRAKALLLLPGRPSVRLRSVIDEFVPGAELRSIGTLSDGKNKSLWDNPMREARVLPDIAARILALEPVVGDTPIIGVESCNAEAKPIPAGHRNTETQGALSVGKALGAAGTERDITIGDEDLRRHWQIVGQTGTGKSTLLANIILEAVKSGRGLTFFDPHGSTIDIILRSVSRKDAGRVRVVRMGDADNPTPINMWPGSRPEDCEKTISDLNLLFSDIFDPGRHGFLGPRWERWFSIFASASIALLGKRASFDSIVTLSQNKANMKKLYDAIALRAPKIAQAVRSEYGDSRSSDLNEVIAWCVCKFQRLTSVPQLRSTLGAGANALRFERTIDTDAVTLIDLASPTVGVHAARIVGTLLLLQLWNAATARERRDKTHIIALDEAQLFQTNPLPQMLAEGRKFGIALIPAHQHCGQLSSEVRDALDANSANFSAFRMSVRDSFDAANRFDHRDGLRGELCRMNAFNALTTISVDGRQTDAFTLGVTPPKPQRNGEAIAAEIERRSRDALVEPYRGSRALTFDEVTRLLNKYAENPLPPYKESTCAKPVPPAAQAKKPKADTMPAYIKQLDSVMRSHKQKAETAKEGGVSDAAV